MMDKLIRAFYILIIAIVVFLGGLLISKGVIAKAGAAAPHHAAMQAIESQEGSAL